MNARSILTILFLFLFTALPVHAQEDCAAIFKAELTGIEGVREVSQSPKGFLAILDTDKKAETIKIISAVKKMRNEISSDQCDFSGMAVVLLDNELNQLKSGTSQGLDRNDVSNLLYKYVYDLSPIELEQNLRGYEKLTELSPKNSYYAARVEHYKKRIALKNDRNKFIAACLKGVRNDESILDLKVKKDFYLFITDSARPLETASSFLEKIAGKTNKPDKKLCIIAYDANLAKRETDCSAEYNDVLNATEEELLMRYVQSVPGYKIESNVNGYAALKRLNPASALYVSKYNSYKIKMDGVARFLKLRAADGEKVFSRNSTKGSTLYVTVNDKALQGHSKSANRKFLQTLTSYYQRTGRAYSRCVLKSQTGKTLGTINCARGNCRLE